MEGAVFGKSKRQNNVDFMTLNVFCMTLESKSYHIFTKAMLSTPLRNAEVWEEMSLFLNKPIKLHLYLW